MIKLSILFPGAEVVARQVSTVEVEDEVSTREAIKVTVVVEEAAEATNLEDPLPTQKKNH